MASLLYNSFVSDAFAGNLQSGSTYKMMLVTSSYTPNKDHSKRSDITNEITGTGYTAGGSTCTVTVTKDDTNDRVSVSIGSVSWPTATLTARRAVVYRSRGGASSADELVACIDFLGDVTSTGGTFSVTETTPFLLNTP